jgi:hypothetical protein
LRDSVKPSNRTECSNRWEKPTLRDKTLIVTLGLGLEVFWPEVLQFKEIAEKASRAFGDDHHVQLGDPLKARREIRRLGPQGS